MVKGSKNYLKKVRDQITKDLEMFEIKEKEYISLFNTLPKNQQDFQNKFIFLDKINLKELELRVNQMKSMINEWDNVYPIVLEKINSDKRLKEYASLSKYELVKKEEEINEKITQFKLEDEKNKTKNEELNWLISLPTVSKKSDLLSFYSIEDAKSHFEDNYGDYLECGQGFYQDKAKTFCYVKDRLLSVTINAEIIGQKMDVGDRLYSVDRIKSIDLEPFDQSEYEKITQLQLEELIKAKEKELEKLKNKKIK